MQPKLSNRYKFIIGRLINSPSLKGQSKYLLMIIDINLTSAKDTAHIHISC